MMIRKRIPSLNWLRVFEAAGRTESFARAAELLGMSAPAVSQQIRSLESHFEKALFIREPKRIRLTEAGRAFLPTVQRSLASIETTAATVFGSDEVEQVMVQAIALIAMGWLPSVVAEFEAANPKVKVNIMTMENLSEVASKEAWHGPDIQIGFGSGSDFSGNAERIFGEDIYAVARPDIVQQLASTEALQATTFFQVSTHQSGWFQVLADQNRLDPSEIKIKVVDSTPIALMMAVEGLGVALARSPASDGLVRSLNLQPCQGLSKVRGSQHYYILSSERAEVENGVAKLRDWILKSGHQAVNGEPF